MKYIQLEEAINLIKENVTYNSTFEEVNLLDARNRVAYEDIFSTIDNPPFNRSPIDGYSCKSCDLKDIKNDNYVKLNVIGEICAGDSKSFNVQKGECVRIMTGAMIPENCDCCIKQEDTDEGDEIVKIYKMISKNENFCFKGEDYKKDTLLVSKDSKLTYAHIGVLASSGINRVKVYQMPKIAIISTGDEVVECGKVLNSGKIYNSNSYMIKARLLELGFSNILINSISDDEDLVYDCIKDLSKEFDVIVTTGGVSVGKKDIFHEVVKKEDMKQIFWKIQIQPGTPIMFSLYKDTPVVSLSGNPFASLVNFELIVRELLGFMYKDDALVTKKFSATLKSDFNKKSIKRRFIRGIYDNYKGVVTLPCGLHSSGVLSSLVGCNCLIDIKAGTSHLKSGDTVKVILL